MSDNGGAFVRPYDPRDFKYERGRLGPARRNIELDSWYMNPQGSYEEGMAAAQDMMPKGKMGTFEEGAAGNPFNYPAMLPMLGLMALHKSHEIPGWFTGRVRDVLDRIEANDYFGAAEPAMDLASLGPGGAQAAALTKLMEVPENALASGAARMKRRAKPGQTVTNPIRDPAHPGIYGDPREIARVAAENSVPESPNLKRVWGVTRRDLDEMNEFGKLKGNLAPEDFLNVPKKPRGAEAARKVMNPRNAQRLVDILVEAGKYPNLRAMDHWFMFDPVYDNYVRRHGEERGLQYYNRLNSLTASMSPGSDVEKEIRRGLLANYQAQQILDKTGMTSPFPVGDPKFIEEFGVPGVRGKGGVGFFDWGADKEKMAEHGIVGVPGHAYHRTSHTSSMRNALKGEKAGEPKVPSYTAASGVTGINKQTSVPVGDAHWSRGVGLADARVGPKDVGKSVSNPEILDLAPWWRNKVAEPVGLEAVPGQARQWGVLAPFTGVDTKIGASKLEILADIIAERARYWDLPLEQARDMILDGKLYSNRVGIPTGAVPTSEGVEAPPEMPPRSAIARSLDELENRQDNSWIMDPGSY